ncbi:coleoptericin [Rhyzopertha dominica]|nr:coleoptericin [Rhyzopertha dominica]
MMPTFIIALMAVITVSNVYPYRNTLPLLAMNNRDIEDQIHQVSDSDAEEGRGRFLVNYGLPDVEEEDREKRSVVPQELEQADSYFLPPQADEFLVRHKRSWQPGAPDYSKVGNQGSNSNRNHGVDIQRENGNTKVSVNTQHKGDGYEVNGQWSKVVRGPQKSKPEWHVGVNW